jgi:hydrogenase-4 component H
MFKHTISELKEALVCLQAGQVTLEYPFRPHPPDGEFRGLPQVEASNCIGCGACANACPARLISLSDDGEYRLLEFELGRCTYCASCRDACPQQAITMSPEFETSTGSKDDLVVKIRLKLVRCRLCGQVVTTQRALDRVKNDLAQSGKFSVEMISGLDLCLSCKRKEALRTTSLVMEVAR